MQFLDVIHLSWIIIYLAGGVGLCWWLKRKETGFQRRFVYQLILANFVLHFVGPWLVQDTLEGWLFRISFINTCAVLVFISPFVYWQEDKFLKPGWLYMCVIGALGLIVFPEYAIGYNPFSLNILRLFVQHAILLWIPMLMLVLGHYRISYRDLWAVGVCYVLILMVVVANDAILESLGIVHSMRWWNGAFQWHPGTLHGMVQLIVPDWMMHTPFGPNAGDFVYWPVLYMLPVIGVLLLPTTALIMALLRLLKKKLAV